MAWPVAIVVVVLYIQFREQIAELRGIVARLQDEVRELRRQVAGAPIASRRETERPPVVHAPSPSTPRIVPTASRPTTPLAPAYVPPRKYAAEERPPAKSAEPVQITPDMLEQIETGATEWEELARATGARPGAPPPPPPRPPA